jgi:hypothetical protein
MPKYSIGCSCGHTTTVEADTREEAVELIKAGMTEENVAAHMAEKHPGDPVPAVEDAHARIEKELVEVS